MIHASRGCGERLRDISKATFKATDGGAVGGGGTG